MEYTCWQILNSRQNTKLFTLLIINESSFLFDNPSSRPLIFKTRQILQKESIKRPLNDDNESYKGPKQHFFGSFALKTLYNIVHLRKKHLVTSMTSIYFVACNKIQTWSPDPGPNLRRRSSQYSLQGADPALLLRPCWCFPHYVFFSFIFLFFAFLFSAFLFFAFLFFAFCIFVMLQFCICKKAALLVVVASFLFCIYS